MTFISLGIEKSCLGIEKDQLEYQLLVATGNYNYVTSEMADLSKDNVETDTPEYQELESYQELYDSQKEALDSQLEVINAEIDSYEKAKSGNIKSECKLNLSV